VPRFSEAIEEEFKFIPQDPESVVIAQMARVFGPEFGFVKWPTSAVIDIYLDTPDLLLFHANASLRLRRRATPCKLKPGVSSNFKYPPASSESLRRRELKTRLSYDEAEQVCQGAIIGESCSHAAALAGWDPAASAGFSPQIVVETYESAYVLRRRCSADGWELERTPASDLLILCFDRCIMYEAPTVGVSRFLRKGILDIGPGRRFVEAYEAEVELTPHCGDAGDVGGKLYLSAFEAIRESGAPMPERSKYSAAIESIK
jgi:hypothetical protein